MSNPPIEPVIKYGGGSAFKGNTTQAYRPIPELSDGDRTVYVSLVDWCRFNFISRDVGYTLIKKHYLIAIRRHGYWWVTSNPDCINELLEYLGIEELLFDAVQD